MYIHWPRDINTAVAREKLNIVEGEVTVHLSDDTEIDDDDYLQCLDDHVVLYVRPVSLPVGVESGQ